MKKYKTPIIVVVVLLILLANSLYILDERHKITLISIFSPVCPVE